MSNIEVIGIDHGWSAMKTNSQVFATEAKEIANEPPMRNDILQYNGRYYSIGERRLEVRADKTENENFYLLTLAGIAKELRNYAENVCNSLREYKINLKTTKIVFVGGGAAVMKNFGQIQQRIFHIYWM